MSSCINSLADGVKLSVGNSTSGGPLIHNSPYSGICDLCRRKSGFVTPTARCRLCQGGGGVSSGPLRRFPPRAPEDLPPTRGTAVCSTGGGTEGGNGTDVPVAPPLLDESPSSEAPGTPPFVASPNFQRSFRSFLLWKPEVSAGSLRSADRSSEALALPSAVTAVLNPEKSFLAPARFKRPLAGSVGEESPRATAESPFPPQSTQALPAMCSPEAPLTAPPVPRTRQSRKEG